MKFKTNIYSATFYQFFIFLLFFWLTRILFFLYNLPFFPGISCSYLIIIMFLGLPFDLSGALYFNLLFLLMRFIPAPFTYNGINLKVKDRIYHMTNSFVIVLNFGDSFFYQLNNSEFRFYTSRIMAQYGLLPATLSLINHGEPYVSLVNNNVPHYANNFNDSRFQVINEDLLVKSDAEKDLTGRTYDIKNDHLFIHPLENYDKTVETTCIYKLFAAL